MKAIAYVLCVLLAVFLVACSSPNLSVAPVRPAIEGFPISGEGPTEGLVTLGLLTVQQNSANRLGCLQADGVWSTGQSFIPTQSGDLTAIAVHSGTTRPATLTIYEGEGNSGTLLHTQDVTLVGGGDNPFFPMPSISFTAAVPVIGGSTYTFYVSGGTCPAGQHFAMDDRQPYPGGTLFFNGVAYPFDLRFRAEIENGTSADADGPYNVDEGSSITLDATASFADPAADPLTYAWDLDNDGLFDDATGATPSFTGFDGPATLPVAVRVTDGLGFIDTARSTVTVHNVAPTISLTGAAQANEGKTYSLTLGAVSDPGSDTVTQYTVNWGDGSSDTYGAAGVVTHVYADGPASPTITVDLTDEDGTHIAAGSMAITVHNVAPEISAFNLDATSIIAGGSVTATGSFGDVPADTATGSLDWGDGATTGGLSSGFTENHVYSLPGTYLVTLNVEDEDGGSSSATLSIRVITPSAAIDALMAQVSGLAHPKNKSMLSILKQAKKSFAKGKVTSSLNKLSAFISQVEAQRGKKIPEADADMLVAEARRIVDAIN